MIARIGKRLQRKAKPAEPRSFRQRYQEIEARRAAMFERLKTLDDEARSHPGYRRVLVLLNERFRSARIAQRMAILQSAEWLIDVLETLTLIA